MQPWPCADRPPQQFRDNGDGTVSDLTTGLMWQQDSVQGISWKDGLAYCSDLQLGGYSDWRLPDVNELISLVDYSQSSPSIDESYFTNTSTHYWSSTTYPSDPRKAYHVCFLRGRAEVYGKSDQGAASHLRAVRGIVSDNSSTTTTVPGAAALLSNSMVSMPLKPGCCAGSAMRCWLHQRQAGCS